MELENWLKKKSLPKVVKLALLRIANAISYEWHTSLGPFKFVVRYCVLKRMACQA